MQAIDILRELSDAFGVSGFEDEVRACIQKRVEPYVDDVTVDDLGNLFAVRRGGGDMTLLVDAHTDEVGFMVKWIDEGGFVRLAALGGWDERIIPGHRVTLWTRSGEKRLGIIGTTPPHILDESQRKQPIPLDKLFVDVGASSRQEALDMGIQIGDPLTIHYPFAEVADGYVTGKAFDDRAGCTVALQVAERLADEDVAPDVVFAFVIGEETGLRGARTAARQIQPDVGLALEGTLGADMPGIAEENQPVRLGRGPAITVADRSIVVSRDVVIALEQAAEHDAIPYQYKLPAYGGTDAGVIHVTGKGIRTGVLSVPCRFIHSPTSTLRLNDLENTTRLAHRFIQTAADVFG